MLSKSSLSHIPGDINSAQVTNMRDIHEHFTLLDVPHLTSPWW